MKNAPEFAANSFQKNYRHAVSAEYKDSPGCANPDFHMHDQYELLLCLSENMFCAVGDRQTVVGPNTLLLFNSTDQHRFGPLVPNGENRRYVLYFEPSFLDYLSEGEVNLLDCFLFRPFDDAYVLPLTLEQSQLLQDTFSRIIRLQHPSQAETYGNSMRLMIAVQELMLDINIFYRRYHGLESTASSGNRQLVYDVISFINRNYAEELRLDTLAQHFYINKYSLCQSFKQITGITLSQYIINYRLQKAKEFLSKGLSVERVCAQAGFNNLSHFSRQFKEKVGLSPKQYQKQFQKESLPAGGSGARKKIR